MRPAYRRAPLVASRVVCLVALEPIPLATCLNVLAERDLNLTKLESRPVKDTPWEYLFYIDFEGNLADDGTSAALTELESHTSYLKILGSYPVSRSSS